MHRLRADLDGRVLRVIARVVWLVVLASGCGSGETAGPERRPASPASSTRQAPETPQTPLEEALASSATGPRLRTARLVVDAGGTEPGAEAVGASESFRVRRADGSAQADVFHFGRYDALTRAQPTLDAHPVPADGAALLVANGAFLVRVTATGPGAEATVAEIASTIAGEE